MKHQLQDIQQKIMPFFNQRLQTINAVEGVHFTTYLRSGHKSAYKEILNNFLKEPQITDCDKYLLLTEVQNIINDNSNFSKELKQSFKNEYSGYIKDLKKYKIFKNANKALLSKNNSEMTKALIGLNKENIKENDEDLLVEYMNYQSKLEQGRKKLLKENKFMLGEESEFYNMLIKTSSKEIARIIDSNNSKKLNTSESKIDTMKLLENSPLKSWAKMEEVGHELLKRYEKRGIKQSFMDAVHYFAVAVKSTFGSKSSNDKINNIAKEMLTVLSSDQSKVRISKGITIQKTAKDIIANMQKHVSSSQQNSTNYISIRKPSPKNKQMSIDN